jgi:hypothetical protein
MAVQRCDEEAAVTRFEGLMLSLALTFAGLLTLVATPLPVAL